MVAIAIVVAGGPLTWPSLVPPSGDEPRPADRIAFDEVVAVDGGLDVALAAGLQPTLLLGDLDSVSVAALGWAHDHDLPVIEHPADKDDTDTALALAHVAATRRLEDTDVVLLGATATDRFDHVLGTLAALGAPALADARSVRAALGGTDVHVLHPGHEIELRLGAGRTLSLLALHGSCDGVGITGVRWPLVDHRIAAGSTLGISNETVLDTARATNAGNGVLTVVVPPADAASAAAVRS